MTMRKHADLLATVGEWTDNQGQKHKRRMHCGVVMRDDRSGRLAVRIELLPVAREWSGWLAVRPCGEGAGHD